MQDGWGRLANPQGTGGAQATSVGPPLRGLSDIGAQVGASIDDLGHEPGMAFSDEVWAGKGDYESDRPQGLGCHAAVLTLKHPPGSGRGEPWPLTPTGVGAGWAEGELTWDKDGAGGDELESWELSFPDWANELAAETSPRSGFGGPAAAAPSIFADALRALGDGTLPGTEAAEAAVASAPVSPLKRPGGDAGARDLYSLPSIQFLEGLLGDDGGRDAGRGAGRVGRAAPASPLRSPRGDADGDCGSPARSPDSRAHSTATCVPREAFPASGHASSVPTGWPGAGRGEAGDAAGRAPAGVAAPPAGSQQPRPDPAGSPAGGPRWRPFEDALAAQASASSQGGECPHPRPAYSSDLESTMGVAVRHRPAAQSAPGAGPPPAAVAAPHGYAGLAAPVPCFDATGNATGAGMSRPYYRALAAGRGYECDTPQSYTPAQQGYGGGGAYDPGRGAPAPAYAPAGLAPYGAAPAGGACSPQRFPVAYPPPGAHPYAQTFPPTLAPAPVAYAPGGQRFDDGARALAPHGWAGGAWASATGAPAPPAGAAPRVDGSPPNPLAPRFVPVDVAEPAPRSAPPSPGGRAPGLAAGPADPRACGPAFLSAAGHPQPFDARAVALAAPPPFGGGAQPLAAQPSWQPPGLDVHQLAGPAYVRPAGARSVPASPAQHGPASRYGGAARAARSAASSPAARSPASRRPASFSGQPRPAGSGSPEPDEGLRGVRAGRVRKVHSFSGGVGRRADDADDADEEGESASPALGAPAREAASDSERSPLDSEADASPPVSPGKQATKRPAVGRGKRGRRTTCLNCGAHQTPQWRCGPLGPRTLCNACGVRYKKGLPLHCWPLREGMVFPPGVTLPPGIVIPAGMTVVLQPAANAQEVGQ